MPTNEELEVAVYYDNANDRDLALKTLKECDSSQDIRFYDGVVEGRISKNSYSELRKQGLLIDSLRPQTPDPEPDEVVSSVDADPVVPQRGMSAVDDAQPMPASESFSPTEAIREPPARSRKARFSTTFRRSKSSDPELKRQLDRFTEKAQSSAAREIQSRAKRSPGSPRRRNAAPTSRRVTRSTIRPDELLEEVAFTESTRTLGEEPESVSSAALEPESLEDVYEVKFNGPDRPEWRAALEEQGLEVCSFEPPNSYRMFLDDSQRELVQKLPFVETVEPYSLSETVTPELLTALEKAEQVIRRRGDPTVAIPAELLSLAGASASPPGTFQVICHRSKDLPMVRRMIKEEGVAIIDQSDDTIRFEVDVDSPLLAALADLSAVKKVEPYQAPSLFSNLCRTLIGVSAVSQGAAQQYTGEGEVIGIFDSGIDKNHPDFSGRVKAAVSFRGASPVDEVGHGTHVAGIIAGTGAASNEEKICGVAPGAELVVVGIVKADRTLELPVDLGELLREAVQRGAKIINLSWGTPIGGSYDQGSGSVDKFIYENPEILVVVAAGNWGVAPDGFVTYRSIGTPASAKNVLTVGACATDRSGINKTWGTYKPSVFPGPPTSSMAMAGNPDLPAALSSRGPTANDSVKPDLLAPGTYVLSARSSHFLQGLAWEDYPKHDNSYTYIGGSSMAAPMVSGAAAVVRQYLRETLATDRPSAALLKAILIASTKRLKPLRPDMDDVVGYPDFDQGFGRLDLRNVLPHADAPSSRKFVFADVANDAAEALQSRMPVGEPRKSSRTYLVKVKKDSVEPLIVVLTWTDRPGNGVQNNLQLDVRGPVGLAMVGNPQHRFLRRDPLLGDANAEDVAFDKRNNVETVRIDPAIESLPGGEYRIRVIAQNTAFPPQGYALCVIGELDSKLVVE